MPGQIEADGLLLFLHEELITVLRRLRGLNLHLLRREEGDLAQLADRNALLVVLLQHRDHLHQLVVVQPKAGHGPGEYQGLQNILAGFLTEVGHPLIEILEILELALVGLLLGNQMAELIQIGQVMEPQPDAAILNHAAVRRLVDVRG